MAKLQDTRSRRAAELRQSWLGPLFFWLYRLLPSRRLRGLVAEIITRLEGDEYYSATARRILETFHGVKVGAYSYGPCVTPGRFPAGVTVGRYVSVAPEVRIYLRNHPMDRLSTHPFFFNKDLGFLPEDSIPTGSLEIGHDAWIGHGAIITAGCSRIGIGAVVGAGAVVTKDVPDFAVVAGTPARLIRYRFPEEICDLIRASKWWEHSAEECVRHMREMSAPLTGDLWKHPLLMERAADTDGAQESLGVGTRLPS